MSNLNHNEQQLLNATYTATRELRAEADEQKARLDKLVTTMNEFREQAMEMLTEMSKAHAPKEKQ